MAQRKLHERDTYLKKLLDFKDKDLIKVITGIRRCGKSSLMQLMIERLKNDGTPDNQILYINFESMSVPVANANDFYNYVKNHIDTAKHTYLFFDEVQKVADWQKAVNSFRVDFDCDIYITGSNAYLLSSELSTYLSGRYIEIKVLPLSFKEFLDFHGFEILKTPLPTGGIKRQVKDKNDNVLEVREAFDAYMKFGGMPILADIGFNEDLIFDTLDAIYSACVINDILERSKYKDKRKISDATLLRKIGMFLADNIGNNTSATSIANVLISENTVEKKVNNCKPAVQTVQFYIESLKEAYIFYEIKRFDIKGKEYLRTLGKYYIVDSGLRNYLLGFRNLDSGRLLENIVYFEFLRRGYNVSIGKIDNLEIDFIVSLGASKKYVQVCQTLSSQDTRERELRPLLKVNDNFEKIILTLDCNNYTNDDGIKICDVLDFLLDEDV